MIAYLWSFASSHVSFHSYSHFQPVTIPEHSLCVCLSALKSFNSSSCHQDKRKITIIVGIIHCASSPFSFYCLTLLNYLQFSECTVVSHLLHAFAYMISFFWNVTFLSIFSLYLANPTNPSKCVFLCPFSRKSFFDILSPACPGPYLFLDQVSFLHVHIASYANLNHSCRCNFEFNLSHTYHSFRPVVLSLGQSHPGNI